MLQPEWPGMYYGIAKEQETHNQKVLSLHTTHSTLGQMIDSIIAQSLVCGMGIKNNFPSQGLLEDYMK